MDDDMSVFFLPKMALSTSCARGPPAQSLCRTGYGSPTCTTPALSTTTHSPPDSSVEELEGVHVGRPDAQPVEPKHLMHRASAGKSPTDACPVKSQSLNLKPHRVFHCCGTTSAPSTATQSTLNLFWFHFATKGLAVAVVHFPKKALETSLWLKTLASIYFTSDSNWVKAARESFANSMAWVSTYKLSNGLSQTYGGTPRQHQDLDNLDFH